MVINWRQKFPPLARIHDFADKIVMATIKQTQCAPDFVCEIFKWKDGTFTGHAIKFQYVHWTDKNDPHF